MTGQSIGTLLKVLGVVLAGLSVIGGFILSSYFSVGYGNLNIYFIVLGVISGGTMLVITGLGYIVSDVADIKKAVENEATRGGSESSSSVSTTTVRDNLPQL